MAFVEKITDWARRVSGFRLNNNTYSDEKLVAEYSGYGDYDDYDEDYQDDYSEEYDSEYEDDYDYMAPSDDSYRPVSRRSGVSAPKYTPTVSSSRSRRTAEPASSSAGPSIYKLAKSDSNYKIVVEHPQSVSEAAVISEYLRDNRAVIVNLESLSPKEAQRIVDVICGVSYALEGSHRFISSTRRVMLVAPAKYNVSGKLDVEDDDAESYSEKSYETDKGYEPSSYSRMYG